jgi:hypothetical protein
LSLRRRLADSDSPQRSDRVDPLPPSATVSIGSPRRQPEFFAVDGMASLAPIAEGVYIAEPLPAAPFGLSRGAEYAVSRLGALAL